LVGLLAAAALAVGSNGWCDEKPTEKELAATTERGRVLSEYDRAAWHATDAVQTANPKTAEGQHILARKENGRWTVMFGALNADKTKFLISHEAGQLEKRRDFTVSNDEPARQDEGFYLFAARALELALVDFGKATRPYNVAVLPATQAEGKEQQGLYVYLYPAQTKVGIYPLGGDVRYLVSTDGTKILAKRQLHQTIVDVASAKKKTAAGHHTHVLSDEPEDTDVLLVLRQDPPVPEMITTQHFVYEIASEGTIRIKKQKK
jgi:hypothetical protein